MKRKPARARGGVYTRPDSPNYWLSYTVGGKRIQENTRIAIVQPGMTETATRQKAQDVLLTKQHAVMVTPSLADSRNLKVSDLAERLMADYRANGRKSLGHTERRWRKHLQPFFGNLKASQVNAGLVTDYKNKRLTDGASAASVNRDIAALHRMFTLAADDDRLSLIPRMKRLKEANPRSGYLEDANYAKLAESCFRHGGLWLRAAFECGYCLGWRKTELLTLRVSQVDLMERTIRLDPGTTKNDEGRIVAMPLSVYTLLSACVVGRKPSDYVFRRGDKRILSLRRKWQDACCEVGLGFMHCKPCQKQSAALARCPDCHKELTYSGLLFHDLRRTAVRNMIRAGVPEKITMLVTGHLTRLVFDRYHIVALADMQNAATKLDASRKTNLSYDPVTVSPLPTSHRMN